MTFHSGKSLIYYFPHWKVMRFGNTGENMNPDKAAKTVEESRAALESLGQAQDALDQRARSPIWFIVAASTLLAVVLLGNWVGDDSALTSAAATCALVAFFVLWVFYFARLRTRGLNIRKIPSFPTGWLFLAIQAVYYIALIIVTDLLHERGYSWAPWVGTAIICLSFAVILYRFPTGEPTHLEQRR